MFSGFAIDPSVDKGGTEFTEQLVGSQERLEENEGQLLKILTLDCRHQKVSSDSVSIVAVPLRSTLLYSFWFTDLGDGPGQCFF